MGAGLYHPDPASRTKVTDAIAAKPDAWRAVTSGKEFRRLLSMGGDSLAKMPKQYDPQHPFAEDLKRKDFIVVAPFSEKHRLARGVSSNALITFRAWRRRTWGSSSRPPA